MTTRIRTFKPVKSRVISAAEYLALATTKPDNIESSRFIPPAIGGKGFGRFKITFKHKELVDV